MALTVMFDRYGDGAMHETKGFIVSCILAVDLLGG